MQRIAREGSLGYSSDKDILDYLECHTYDETALKFNTSRGRIWSIAVRERRRKHEHRIQERAKARKQRQAETIKAVVDSVMRADVLDYLDGMPDGAFDMHLTSIPYNLGKQYGGSETVDRRAFHYYLGWILQVLSEMCRTLKDGGTLFLQLGSTRDDSEQLYPLDCLLFEHLRGMGLVFQSRVVWEIPHGLTPKVGSRKGMRRHW